jgi:hypothetical protein
MPVPTAGVGGGGKPLGGAHVVTLAPASTINCIGMALDNLGLAASNNTNVLQLLIATSLALTALVSLLTMADKKLAEALAKKKGVATPAAASGTGGAQSTNTPFPGNYCWTHGHCVSQHHTSVSLAMALWQES